MDELRVDQKVIVENKKYPIWKGSDFIDKRGKDYFSGRKLGRLEHI